jgi:putative sporulation protein YyaC
VEMLLIRNGSKSTRVKRTIGSLTMKTLLQSIPKEKTILFLCIGTPKYPGDAVAPMIGQHLRGKLEKAIVIGTTPDPVHAMNMEETREYIKKHWKDTYIIAIDACVTNNSSFMNKVHIGTTQINPGSALGKNIKAIGDASIRVFTTLKSDNHKKTLDSLRNADPHIVGHLAWDIADYIANSVKRYVVK